MKTGVALAFSLAFLILPLSFLGCDGNNGIGPGNGDGENPCWHIEHIAESEFVVYYSSIALDGNGHPHIAYGAEEDFYYGKIGYAYWDGLDWVYDVVTTQDCLYGWDVDFSLDTSDNPHICFRSSVNENRLKYAFKNGSTWDIEDIGDDIASPDIINFSLDINRSNVPSVAYIAFYSSTSVLYYAVKEGSEWTYDRVTHGEYFKATSLVIDSFSHPHIALYKGKNEGFYYLYYNGTDWYEEKISSYNEHTAPACSIAIDSGDRPHIAYIDGETVTYAYPDGSSWAIERIGPCLMGEGYENVSLSVDENGVPHVCYTGKERNITYAYREGSNWVISYVERSDDGFAPSSLYVDSEIKPHVSFSNDARLKYAWYGVGAGN